MPIMLATYSTNRIIDMLVNVRERSFSVPGEWSLWECECRTATA